VIPVDPPASARQKKTLHSGETVMNPLAILLTIGCILLTTGLPARAADYYVSPTGDDRAAGTAADNPLRTIGKAAALAEPGTVVHLAPGTYAERVTPARSGTPDAPITIRKDGRGEVVWTAPDAPPAKGMGAALNLDGKGHFIVEGITFKDCTCWITMGDAHCNTVKDCVFDGSKIYNSLWVSNGSYIRILNCDFKRARPYVTDENGVSTNKTASDFIEFFRNCNHNLVEGCRFGEIGHVAVLIEAFQPGCKPTYNIVRNCTFTNPMWKCLGTHAAEYTLIEGCTMTGKSAVFYQFESPKTIVRRNLFYGWRSSLPDAEDTLRGVFRVGTTKDNDVDCPFRDNRIYHNLFYDNDRTITSYAAQGPIENNVFKNNIFFHNRMTLWLCQPDYTTQCRTYFTNNVLCGMAPGQKIFGYEAKQFTLAEAQRQMPELCQGNIEADPLFTDAAKNDFRLRDGSPCIDAGADLTATSSAGHGTLIPVEDPLYFSDGFGLIEGDRIVVGGQAVKILRVDYEKKTLEVDRTIAWKKGDGVNQPFSGKAPDIGPFEKQAGPS